MISSSKPSTCLLNSIPTRLLKEVSPLVSTSLLDMINMSLVKGYVLHSFKVAVIKPLLKRPVLDSSILANYRPISNLPFISKIIEKAVTNQLCDSCCERELRFFLLCKQQKQYLCLSLSLTLPQAEWL